jgi:hypothetical protein
MRPACFSTCDPRGSRNVAPATLDGELHRQRRALAQGGEVKVGVVDLDAGGSLDVGDRDSTRTGGPQVHGHGLVHLGADDDVLDVENEFGDVLGHAGNGAELVLHAIDADAGHRCAGDRRQQGAPQAVAQGVPETRLERFEDEPGAGVGDELFGQYWPTGDLHFLFLPGTTAI